MALASRPCQKAQSKGSAYNKTKVVSFVSLLTLVVFPLYTIKRFRVKLAESIEYSCSVYLSVPSVPSIFDVNGTERAALIGYI